MKIRSFALLCYVTLPAILAACTIPPVLKPTIDSAVLTEVVQAVQPRLTQTPLSIPESGAPGPQAVIEITLTPAITRVAALEGSGQVPLPSGTGKASEPCDLVSPGLPIDVSVQDGSQFGPGEVFSKTWRLINAGTCTWTRDYSIVWFSGQQMGVQGVQNLPGEVQPGESIDITVDMVTPQGAGTYQSNWKLKNPQGELFGLGPNGNSPFWVQIEVVVADVFTSEVVLSPEPTLPVYASNISNLVLNDNLDLDSGELNLEGEDDFGYRLGQKGTPEIVPQNNARVYNYGRQMPSEQDCRTAVLGINPLELSNLEEGVYLCYRTNRALPGYMRVQKQTPEDGLISVDFVTWTVP